MIADFITLIFKIFELRIVIIYGHVGWSYEEYQA